MVKTGLTASHFTNATTHHQRLKFTKTLFNYKELASREDLVTSRVGNIHEPSICEVRSFTGDCHSRRNFKHKIPDIHEFPYCEQSL